MIDCNEWRTEKRHECANMGESKTTQIMMATVPHVTSGLGLRKFQADGFLLTRVYLADSKTVQGKDDRIWQASVNVLFLTDFKKYRNIWTRFSKYLTHEFSRQSIQWECSWFARLCSRTDMTPRTSVRRRLTNARIKAGNKYVLCKTMLFSGKLELPS